MPRDPISEKLELDHFKVYHQRYETEPQKVELKGQFDSQQLTAELGQMLCFANPVSKNRSRLIDKNAHFAIYELHGKHEPRRIVVIRNQFGLQQLILDQPRFLLVPAEKVERGSAAPKRLDHFKAYKVLEGKPVDRQAALADQIDRSDRVLVSRPEFFCVPVEKRHGRKITRIVNPKGHLTFYSVTTRPHRVDKLSRDQFGEHKLRLGTSFLLGVPTLKIEFDRLE